MIESIEFWLMPQVTVAAASTFSGQLHSVVDIDDTTNLTSLAQFGDYTNCVTTEATQGHYRHFTPHIAMAAYGTGAFTSFANVKHEWIDVQYPTVAHYGVKYGVSVTSTAFGFDTRVRLTLRLRSVR